MRGAYSTCPMSLISCRYTLMKHESLLKPSFETTIIPRKRSPWRID